MKCKYNFVQWLSVEIFFISEDKSRLDFVIICHFKTLGKYEESLARIALLWSLFIKNSKHQ